MHQAILLSNELCATVIAQQHVEELASEREVPGVEGVGPHRAQREQLELRPWMHLGAWVVVVMVVVVMVSGCNGDG